MLDHHLQKDILIKLVVCESARFAELKPKNIDGNLFTYHLQQLIRQKYVKKNDDGSYCLTAQGKALGINSQLSPKEYLEQAHSILLLAVRRDDSWLLRRRLAQPMFGRYGFVHGEPLASESAPETAAKILTLKTGLSATFTPRGSGYIRIFLDDALESFTSFTLLEAHDLKGTLKSKVGNGENSWLTSPDFTGEDMVPSMASLVDALEASENNFYVELSYHLSTVEA